MKKGLLAIIIVLALLSCMLLGMIIIKATNQGENGNSVSQTDPQDTGHTDPDGAEPESETVEETAPPAGPIDTEKGNGWDLPEF